MATTWSKRSASEGSRARAGQSTRTTPPSARTAARSVANASSARRVEAMASPPPPNLAGAAARSTSSRRRRASQATTRIAPPAEASAATAATPPCPRRSTTSRCSGGARSRSNRGERGAGDQEPHVGVADPEWPESRELLGDVEAQALAADDRVDRLRRGRRLGPELGARPLAEGAAECLDTARLDLEPRRRTMAPE